ncbi:MAG: type II toxin-antitoxin system prevent-host-death family antitoxin, partial [Anaerolineales bacterium]|nr:type II toxin-antitoxin system prevent-host-death family antitoxin [Anaerolineales bacterium]
NSPTVRVVSATEAKNKFGEIIRHAYAADEHLIVEKSGIPVVAIIPMADYRQLVGTRSIAPAVERKVDAESKRAEASRRLGELLAQVHATMPNYPEEEVDRVIAQAIAEVRAEQAKKVANKNRKSKIGNRK